MHFRCADGRSDCSDLFGFDVLNRLEHPGGRRTVTMFGFELVHFDKARVVFLEGNQLSAFGDQLLNGIRRWSVQ